MLAIKTNVQDANDEKAILVINGDKITLSLSIEFPI